MTTNSTYCQNVNDNIQLELIYEESPVFVGGEENTLSAIVKFKYTGEIPKLSEDEIIQRQGQTTEVKKETNSDSSANGWFGGLGKRFSMQLSGNTARNNLLKELESLDEEDESEKKFNDETLLLGYTQIFGYYMYNDQVFEPSKFQEIQKKSVIGGKLAGITGLEFGDKINEGFLNNVATGFGSIFNSSLIDIEDEKKNPRSDIVPIFTTNQSILFPEIVFKPKSHENLSNSFYINVKLPKFIPPSYSSLTSLQIQYNLIIGYQIIDENNKWSNRSLFFPLEIRPFINKFGQQPLYDLLNPVIGFRAKQKSISIPELQSNFKDIKRKLLMNRRRSSTMTISTFNNEINSNETIENENNGDIKNDRQKFFEFIREMKEKNVNELIGVQEKFETEFLYHRNNDSDDVKENLINIFNNPNNVAMNIKKHNENPQEQPLQDDEPKELVSQIPAKQQLNFILKRNGKFITTISISHQIITFNEILKVHLKFQNSEVVGLIIKLQKIEKFNNEEYLRGEDDVELFETKLSENLISCLNTNHEITQDILLPNDVIRTGQFKTNLLETKYSLLFKFILLDKGEAKEEEKFELREIYNDSKGSLYKGIEYFGNGMEFYCKIPIILLSNYEPDFGAKAGMI